MNPRGMFRGGGIVVHATWHSGMTDAQHLQPHKEGSCFMNRFSKFLLTVTVLMAAGALAWAQATVSGTMRYPQKVWK